MNVDSNSLPSIIDNRLGLDTIRLSPHQGFKLYKMDLSRVLYFSGMDDIRYIEFPDESMTDEEAYYAVSELITKFKWRLQIKIVLLPNNSEELARRLCSLENVMVVSSSDVQRVSASKNVTQPLRDLFRSQIDPNRLVGYQYSGAVTGNRFFGRESELAALMQRPDISYLVTGTRMSGKTSLLMEAKRRLEEIDNYRNNHRPNAIYVDCKRYSTVAGLINAILTEMEERTSFSNIARWESPQRWHAFYSFLRNFVKTRPDKRLHLFLDEYDQVLEIEKVSTAKLTWNLRALQQGNSDEKGKGIIQFVIAGSKDLAEKAAKKGSDFFNFVNDCRLRNFDLGTINLVLQRPMEDLGFKIDDSALIEQELLRESAGRPSSVQFICYNLVKNLVEARKKTITISELRQVVQGSQYLQYYDTTLHENTDVLQRFILAAQSQQDQRRTTFSREDILILLNKKFDVYIDAAKLIHSLNDLVNSGFLVLDDRSAGELRYQLSAPVIKRIFLPSSLHTLVNLMEKQGTVFRLESGGSKH